ncbi:DUF342 domain-containing protein [uncultured Clostridium sp.]|uniref:DUF342 domain-containing protein n=1 Tax=uncultured Clostridium sp. TaxID=59620 RepID=UPI0025ED580E|nr:flagellar assembly protein A [uncultured Clostridium sp.]
MNSKLKGIITKKLYNRFENKNEKTDEELINTLDAERYSENSSQFENSGDDDLTYDNKSKNISTNNNGIRVENGKIIVENNDDDFNKNFIIESCIGINLYINGELCRKNTKYNVTQFDNITFESDKIQGTRNITITMSEDFMEAYLDLSYTPEYVYRLKDREPSENLKLKAVREKLEFPNKYNESEITDELKKSGIKFGIIKENILKAIRGNGCDKLIIARGKKPIDDKPEDVKIFFELGNKSQFNTDSMDRIDYKNAYSISNINANQILAEITPEEQGEDGRNIKNEIIKRKTQKSRPIKAGDGCKIENNKVIATRSGRPSSKNGVFNVSNVYNIQNVDMKSGNINFVGDVEISGTVGYGMNVKAGNSIIIRKDVDNAQVMAGGEIRIDGNIINSQIRTGQVDIERKEYLDILISYKEQMNKLIEEVIKLDESSSSKKRVCDITRLLIENRHKIIPKLSLNIISRSIKMHDEEDNELIDFLRNKIMGLNICNIKGIKDLEHLQDLIQEEIDYYNEDMIIQSDIYVGYLQDSLVKSTGSIFVTGKGEYVTNLIAFKDIEFLQSNAVARGGLISAKGNIKLGTVGSSAGVSTRVEVKKHGIITAQIAYANTIFAFDKRSKTLDEDSRNVKVYMDKSGEIIIEKLKL